jgi:hypothetical protein
MAANVLRAPTVNVIVVVVVVVVFTAIIYQPTQRPLTPKLLNMYQA